MKVPKEPKRIVHDLRENSGLSDSQISRALGISRRTLYTIAEKGTTTGDQAGRLLEFWELVFSLPVEAPEARRELLLSSSSGRSKFHEFLEGSRVKSPPLQYLVPMKERLGID